MGANAKQGSNERLDKRRFAEALNVLTKSVLSVQSDDGGRSYTVLYTEVPTSDPDAMLYRAVLWTNIENILEVVQVNKLCSVGKFKAQVLAIQGGIMQPIDKLGGSDIKF